LNESLRLTDCLVYTWREEHFVVIKVSLSIKEK